MLRISGLRFLQPSNTLKITPQIKHQVKEFVVSQSSKPSKEEIVSHLLENGVDMSMLPTFEEIDDIFDAENKPRKNGIKIQKYTPEQLEILERKYKQNPFPSRQDRKTIEKLLGIETDQDKLFYWFYNKRRKQPNVLQKRDVTFYHKRIPEEKMDRITKFFERFEDDEIPREKIKDFSTALGLTVKQVRNVKNSRDKMKRQKKITENVSKEQIQQIYQWLQEDLSRTNPTNEQLKEGSDKFNVSLQALNLIISKKRIEYKHVRKFTEAQKKILSINDEPAILLLMNKLRKRFYPELPRITIQIYELMVKAYEKEPFMSPHKAIKNIKKFRITPKDYSIFIHNIDKVHGNNLERYNQGRLIPRICHAYTTRLPRVCHTVHRFAATPPPVIGSHP